MSPCDCPRMTPAPMNLDFLPIREDWKEGLAAAQSLSGPESMRALRSPGRLPNSASRRSANSTEPLPAPPKTKTTRASVPSLRLAIIGSATLSHLAPAIRVAALRRGLLVEVHEGGYAMYLQELMDTTSPLHAFRPDVLLLALDAHHLAESPGATADHALATMEQCWALAKQHLHCIILQQTILPVFPPVLGNNEQRLSTSPAAIVEQINAALRPRADLPLASTSSPSTPSIVSTVSPPGTNPPSGTSPSTRSTPAPPSSTETRSPASSPPSAASPPSASSSTSTTPSGAASSATTASTASSSARAAPSASPTLPSSDTASPSPAAASSSPSARKNDESNARLPFTSSSLRWSSRKATSPRSSPTGRTRPPTSATSPPPSTSASSPSSSPTITPPSEPLSARNSPSSRSPSYPSIPALYIDAMAGAGYFEGLRVTAEDQERNRQYQANAERARMKDQVTDIESYLKLPRHGVHTSVPFREADLARVTQLTNKTNQFNLTTRRYTEEEVTRNVLADPLAITLQVRLTDRFGDNGTHRHPHRIRRPVPGTARIDTWLMSCRVLGRRVEEACLNTLAAACIRRGVRHAQRHRSSPTKKTAWSSTSTPASASPQTRPPAPAPGELHFTLDLSTFEPRPRTL